MGEGCRRNHSSVFKALQRTVPLERLNGWEQANQNERHPDQDQEAARQMIKGTPFTFAIESHIDQAYENVGLRALGYFVIHIGGLCYGVRELNATLLACSV